MSDGRANLFSLIRLAQPGFREFLITTSNLLGSDNNEIDEMISHSIMSGSFSQATQSTISQGVLGDCVYFSNHYRNVRAVDFSPIEDHLFCSVGIDGKLCTYDARFSKLISSNQLNFNGNISFSGMKFLHDGHRVALSTSSNKILIYDLEKEIILQHIDKCCLSIASKTPIVVDSNTGLLMTPNQSGTGISQIDIRISSVVKNLDHIHANHITDFEILDNSWSRYYTGDSNSSGLILTSSVDRFCKIFDSQKNIIKEFHTSQSLCSVSHPNEVANASSSCIALGGLDGLNFYSLDGSSVEKQKVQKGISKLIYTKSTTKLFTANSDGSLKLYNRSKKKHELVGEVYKHSREIQDIAISRNDEYLITASNDLKVGLIRIGEPLFGPSEIGNVI